jgi:HSP20 family protein
MTLVKFNNRPQKTFSLMEDFLNEMPNLFKEDFNGNFRTNVPVNIKEAKDSYRVDVVAPGFDKADFKVNLEKNILTISAEKKDEVKTEGENQILREYNYRSFTRSFTIDEKINSEKIEAKYVNGVLTLNLPKKEEVKVLVKEISIN